MNQDGTFPVRNGDISLLEGMSLVTHPHLPTSVGRSLMLFSKLTACHAVPRAREEQKKDPFFREKV